MNAKINNLMKDLENLKKQMKELDNVPKCCSDVVSLGRHMCTNSILSRHRLINIEIKLDRPSRTELYNYLKTLKTDTKLFKGSNRDIMNNLVADVEMMLS